MLYISYISDKCYVMNSLWHNFFICCVVFFLKGVKRYVPHKNHKTDKTMQASWLSYYCFKVGEPAKLGICFSLTANDLNCIKINSFTNQGNRFMSHSKFVITRI